MKRPDPLLFSTARTTAQREVRRAAHGPHGALRTTGPPSPSHTGNCAFTHAAAIMHEIARLNKSSLEYSKF